MSSLVGLGKGYVISDQISHSRFTFFTVSMHE